MGCRSEQGWFGVAVVIILRGSALFYQKDGFYLENS